MIKLIGLAVVAVGFAFRVNPLLVVVTAGMVTGLVAGLSWHEVITMMGQFFVDNRWLTLPVILMVPVVGLLERHGLQERMATLIRSAAGATAGRVLWIYQVLRGLTSMVGMGIGGHASMVRPLIVPMAEGATAAKEGALTDAARADIRAHGAAAENVGNFFSDDIVVAVGAVLLIKAFFDNAGVEVPLGAIKLWGLPTALCVILVGWWRYRRLDERLRRSRVTTAVKGEAERSRS
jgi:uncharacterized membrane protein